MDIKEYIASGILESYALGFSSDQERREVECMSSIYPEIKTELASIQKVLESYSESIAVKAPAGVKDAIMKRIATIEQEKVSKLSVEKNDTKTAKVIAMQPSTNRWKISAVASVLVIVGLSLVLYFQVDQNRTIKSNLAQLEKDNGLQNNRLNELNDSLLQSQTLKNWILDQQTQEIKLAATGYLPNSEARVFWNAAKTELILISDSLPKPVSGKQYQLWAIADGTPVDMGVLPIEQSVSGLIKVNANNVQAFAITLENEGGSKVPTLDQMVVVGTINS